MGNTIFPKACIGKILLIHTSFFKKTFGKKTIHCDNKDQILFSEMPLENHFAPVRLQTILLVPL